MISKAAVELESMIAKELLKCQSPYTAREISDALQDLRQAMVRILGHIELDKGIRK